MRYYSGRNTEMKSMTYVGTSQKRKEDIRFLTGASQFVDDIKLPNIAFVSFVRSSYPHAKIRNIDITKASRHPECLRIFTWRDLAPHVNALTVECNLPTYRPTTLPSLASDKVNFEGQPIAMIVASSRYAAEDIKEMVEIDYQELPPVFDLEKALESSSPLIFDEWRDNLCLDLSSSFGDVDKAFSEAEYFVREKFQSNRVAGSPMEPRVLLADFTSSPYLTIWDSTQIPHVLRTILADLIHYPENLIRVISPDVGGGFGIKDTIFPEEVAIAFAAQHVGRPIKWAEDRSEHFLNCGNAQHEIVHVEACANKDYLLTGLKARIIADMGAYSMLAFTGTLESTTTAIRLPGPPYKIQNYSYNVRVVVTNNSPVQTYRGVGQPIQRFVMERIMDLMARKCNIDPSIIRKINVVKPHEFPYTSITGAVHDRGSYVECLEELLDRLDYWQLREEQRAYSKTGKCIGIGLSMYVEWTSPSPSYWATFGMKHIGGTFEGALVRIDPAGKVTVYVGTHSHGQGHETTYAQLVADELGVLFEDVRVVQGDTLTCPYGMGTWASRSTVTGGVSTILAARKLKTKMLAIASDVLEVSPVDLEMKGGKISVKGSPMAGISVEGIAKIAYVRPDLLPKGIEPGLEASYYHLSDSSPLTTIFSNACHAAVVEVDKETGEVKIMRYIVIDDCGRIINPMIVKGQIHGGVGQGIGKAMYEEVPLDTDGRRQASTFIDYLIPTAKELPIVETYHIETPCEFVVGGFRGMAEGSAISPPSAIANAVEDALLRSGHLRSNVISLPLSPGAVMKLLSGS